MKDPNPGKKFIMRLWNKLKGWQLNIVLMFFLVCGLWLRKFAISPVLEEERGLLLPGDGDFALINQQPTPDHAENKGQFDSDVALNTTVSLLPDLNQNVNKQIETQNTNGDAIDTDKKPSFIILVSSSGRSGSTMTAELLRTQQNSVLFFEPIWMVKKEPCFLNGTCVPSFLRRIATCEYEQSFEDWLRWKDLFLQYYHPEAANCFKYPKEGNGKCRRALNIREICKSSSVRITKLIRSRLSWLEGLLSDNSLNVKVVYLTRDPRGSFISLEKLGWNKTPEQSCSNLDTDLRDFERMVKIYPKQLFRLELETMCIEPVKTVSSLFSFLYGNTTLPEQAEEFMKIHMNASRSSSGVMNTVKNSSTEYQAWRWRISEEDLLEVESDRSCRSAIERLGHRIFGSIDNAHDKSISLIKNRIS